LQANDPSPADYRVPTDAEIKSLTNTTYVTMEWTTRNGIGGMRFTDKTSGKSIFLPAAGYLDKGNGQLTNPGTFGKYWSNASVIDLSHSLYFISGGSVTPSSICYKADGYSVRSVAK